MKKTRDRRLLNLPTHRISLTIPPVFLSLCLFIFTLSWFEEGGAQPPPANKSATLITYYPAPVAVFDRVRLTPRPAINATACDVGRLYVNADAGNSLFLCQDDGIDGVWGSLGSVWVQSGDDISLVNTANPELKKVGIGTTSPEFKLSLDYDGGILAKGTFDDPGNASLITAGSGTRFMWYLNKSAIRAGYALSSSWDDGNIGEYSTAFGYGTEASAYASTALGGSLNTASFNHATVIGGSQNTARNSSYTTVAGGTGNNASGEYAVIGGGENNQAQGLYNAVGGGSKNNVNGDGSFIGGGEANAVVPVYGTIGGGFQNTIASDSYGAINGGGQNKLYGAGYGVIGGGENNQILADTGGTSYMYAAIGGGRNNTVIKTASAVKGGSSHSVSEAYSFIGGGEGNSVSGVYAVIAGGQYNSLTANYGFIGGGYDNIVSANYAAVGSGLSNRASGIASFIGSGVDNKAAGDYSTIPGGAVVEVNGDYSWAAGQYARVDGNRIFAWIHAWDAGGGVPAITITQDNAFIIYSDIANDGQDAKLGIGTIDPQERVHVDGNVQIDNGSLYLTAAADQTGDPLEWDPVSGMIGKDIAELFLASEEVEPADLLIIDDASQELSVRKSTIPYDKRVIGVASASPAMVFQGRRLITHPSQFTKGTAPPVALTGQVQVKVSMENGPIRPGDLLTSSSTPGHAMRCDRDSQKSFGRIVGKALEPFDGGLNGETTGAIVIFVSLQ
jgi:hypothetical protein